MAGEDAGASESPKEKLILAGEDAGASESPTQRQTNLAGEDAGADAGASESPKDKLILAGGDAGMPINHPWRNLRGCAIYLNKFQLVYGYIN